MDKELDNPTAGEILKSEFINEIGISGNALAKAVGVPPNRIHAIINNKRSITADTDIRLCKFFKLSDGYFLRLQNLYETTEAKKKLTDKLKLIKPFDEFMKKIAAL